ncbi:MAG: hypothetical protein JNK87_05800 [Bryobacterales bacterium]|nr:hypothetical protein [Bryobacterales bacterium]
MRRHLAIGIFTLAFFVRAVPPTWTTTGSLSNARVYPALAALPSGKVLAAGGYVFSSSAYVTSAEIFDPVLGIWSTTAPLPLGHRYRAQVLANGEVLVMGDDDPSNPTTSAYRYNETSAVWTPAGIPNVRRYGGVTALLPNGNVLFAAGYNNGCCSGPSGTYNTAEIYNPGLNTWTPTGSLTETRMLAAAQTLDSGLVLVAGGTQRDPIAVRGTTELYNPGTGLWSPGGTLNQARFAHTLTRLPNGKVLAAGGYGAASNPLSSIEIYDPVANTWTFGQPMNTPRARHSATVLANGSILFAGGDNDSGPTNTAEIYNPVSNTWSPAPNLSTARSQFGAVRLLTGEVLVAGGYTTGTVALASTEIYSSNLAQQRVFVACQGGDVRVYDSLTTIQNATLAAARPNGIAVSPDGLRTYVSSGVFDNKILVFDNPTNALVTSITVFAVPYGLALSPDGSRLYVTHNAPSSTSVVAIDTATNQAVSLIDIGGPALDIVLSPDGLKAYASQPSLNRVQVINTTTGAVTGNYAVNAPHGMATNPDGTRLYVSARAWGPPLAVIDTATGVFLPAPAVNQSTDVALTPDGSRALVVHFANNNVSMLAVPGHSLITTLPTGNWPMAVAVNPAGTEAYVANYFGNSTTVLDLVNNKVKTTLAGCPGAIAAAFSPDAGPAGQAALARAAKGTQDSKKELTATQYRDMAKAIEGAMAKATAKSGDSGTKAKNEAAAVPYLDTYINLVGSAKSAGNLSEKKADALETKARQAKTAFGGSK